MTTTLKSRRTGVDLRNHPDAPPRIGSKLALRRAPRGAYEVTVAGETWAELEARSRGSRGTVYRFVQLPARHYVMRPGQIIATVASDAATRGDDSRETTFEERVLREAGALIASGSLVHPDEVRQRQETIRQMREEEKAARERAEEDRFRQRAAKAIRAADGADGDALVTEIYKAMRWAQVQ